MRIGTEGVKEHERARCNWGKRRGRVGWGGEGRSKSAVIRNVC